MKRIAAARNMCAVYAQQHALPDWALQLHTACPMWAFFLRKDTGAPCRVYGVVRGKDEISKVHVITAVRKGQQPHLTVMKPNELELVHRWPDPILKRLAKGRFEHAGFYTDPLGFMGILEMYCHDRVHPTTLQN